MNTISEKIKQLYTECEKLSGNDLSLLKKSFEISEKSLSGLQRENGDPFIFHPVEVARILVNELGLSSNSAIAVFLHEASTKSGEAIDLNLFNADIKRIVEGLNKISKIDIKATSLQADNFRKLIVSYSSDPRITLIKLADRLEVMRSLSFFSPLKQIQKAAETKLLYAPLAHQLGLYNLKAELENLAFKYSDPVSYRFVSNKLKATTSEREKIINNFVEPIENELKKQGYKYEIKSRTKTAYSIWRKMQKQNVDFEDVYDVFAIRIILNSKPENEQKDCFSVYSIIENIYKPDEQRFREWITRPKETGYQSLHTTVQTKSKRFVEVQIRSQRMDEIAEKGAAAHWKYKGISQEQSLQKWLDNARKLLEKSEIENQHTIESIDDAEIFVFTPNGDLRRLPNGSTVLDFAFDVHTNVGMRCIGARINGQNATIREKLKTGDTVEITKSKNQKPKDDWLNFVVTSKAKTKIKAALREEKTKFAQIGKENIERKLKNWKLSTFEESVTELAKYYKQKQVTDFYEMIGKGKISITDIKDALHKIFENAESEKTNIPEKKIATKEKNNTSDSEYLIVSDNMNMRGVSYSLAKCCKPIKGDQIFGFVTVNSGVTIHRITCPNASRLLGKYPYRIIKAKWCETQEGNFLASIMLKGENEIGMLNKISDTLQKLNVDMRSIKISSHENIFEGQIEISVSNAKFLDYVIHKLAQIKGIDKVQRIS